MVRYSATSASSVSSRVVRMDSDDIPDEIITVESGDQSLEHIQQPVDIHYDEFDPEQWDSERPLRLYLWADEADDDRLAELEATITDLRSEYVYATGIVLAEELRELEPLSTEQLNFYSWCVVLGTWSEIVDDPSDLDELFAGIDRGEYQ